MEKNSPSKKGRITGEEILTAPSSFSSHRKKKEKREGRSPPPPPKKGEKPILTREKA